MNYEDYHSEYHKAFLSLLNLLYGLFIISVW